MMKEISEKDVSLDPGGGGGGCDAITATIDDDPSCDCGDGCCCFTCSALILYLLNTTVFVLMMWIGELLEEEEEFAVKHKTAKENREIGLYEMAMIAIALINLITLYFLVQQSAASERFYKAGAAVFFCCRQKKEYQEAIVPLQDVGRHICKESLPSWNICCIRLVMVALLFAALVSTAPKEVASSQKQLLLVLCLLAVALWGIAYKLVPSQGFAKSHQQVDELEMTEYDEDHKEYGKQPTEAGKAVV